MKHISRIVLIASLALWILGCGDAKSPDGPGSEAAQTQPVTSSEAPASSQVEAAPSAGGQTSAEAQPAPVGAIEKDRIAGVWERTDAPYQIVISDIRTDGSMKAIYLNPNPIKVSKSNWVDGKGVISIFVELRDVNYPGSNYTLTYFPDRDLLIGKYFQAVEGMTYDVSFARAK